MLRPGIARGRDVLRPGQLIDDKYRIVRLVGEGGMGAVYEAEHAFLERRVAIKVLAAGMTGSAEAIRRFCREAKAAAKIGHENICEVTDVGQTRDGMPYIVMQLPVGRSLAELIAAGGPLRIGRAVDVATQALAGLSRAEFLDALGRLGVSPFQGEPEEVVEEACRD